MFKATRDHYFACALGLAAIAAVACVWLYAWVSEDCFITLRYVSNTLAGHGAVFNVGERVQGYTHPLWFVLLLLGSTAFADPILVATAISLAATALTVLVLGWTLRSRSDDPLIAASLVAVYLGVSLTSDAWVSFQTSGLENALSHLLLALFVAAASSSEARQLRWLPLLASLLAMTRPDFSILVAPAIALLLLAARTRPATLRPIALGALPLLAWVAFALAYYGTIKANTATAKMGTLPSLADEVAQGLHYLADWSIHEPIAAAATFIMLSIGFTSARTRSQRAVVVGVALYLLFVVGVGGDFMRGRLLMPVYNAAFFLGLTACAEALRSRERGRPIAFAMLAGAGIIALLSGPPPLRRETGPNSHGIANERLFYPGYAIAAYRDTGRLENPYMDFGGVPGLQAYAQRCGRFAIHQRNPGTIGYLTGPSVTLIDTLGLTDAFIARLPRDRLADPHPRIGHPDKIIPVAYLASRKDIRLVEGWEVAVERGDCGLIEFVDRLRESELSWIPSATGGWIAAWSPERREEIDLQLGWKSP